ncbi:MAG: hypothetical protein LBC48_06655 [Dysgonamonadaceae bacterium]|jgi:hypothetical protein|nr:hypothetical protein [Dysgonamonadaceae bacterium]
MKKQMRALSLLLCITLAFPLQAQQFVFGYSLGKANYQMGDMKSLMENDVKNLVKTINDYYQTDLQYKNTENFPNGLFHDAYAGVQFSLHEIGLQYNYLTTGGRNHLADYSGELRKDIVFSGDALGLYYKYRFLSIPLSGNFRFSAYAGVATGAIFNHGNSDYFIDLYNPQNPSYGNIIRYDEGEFEKIDESYGLSSTNWYVQPNIGLQFWLKNTISLNINAGYLFDSPGKIRTADENTTNSSVIYIPGYGTTVSTYSYPGREYDFGVSWSGLRLSVGIGFAFSVIK